MTRSTCSLCGVRIIRDACGDALELNALPHVCNEHRIAKYCAERELRMARERYNEFTAGLASSV